MTTIRVVPPGRWVITDQEMDEIEPGDYTYRHDDDSWWYFQGSRHSRNVTDPLELHVLNTNYPQGASKGRPATEAGEEGQEA